MKTRKMTTMIFSAPFLLVLIGLVSGCVKYLASPEIHGSLANPTNLVYIDEKIKLFGDVGVVDIKKDNGERKFVVILKNPVDDLWLAYLGKLYRGSLESALADAGYVVVSESRPGALVLETEMGYRGPTGFLAGDAIGVVGFRTTVYQDGELKMSFDSAMNTGKDLFTEIKPENQVQSKYLHQRTISALKELAARVVGETTQKQN